MVIDALGNTTSLPRASSSLALAYNQQNHLASATANGSITDYTCNYTYNHQRQRLTKQSGTAVSEYVYDLAGRLIATLDVDGVVYEEYVYATQADLSPIQHRVYSDTEALTVEAQTALDKSQQNIADPVDGSGQCAGYGSSPAEQSAMVSGPLSGETSNYPKIAGMPFEYITQDIAWFIPILVVVLEISLDWPSVYLLGGTNDLIDAEDITITWDAALNATEYVLDVATTRQALNNGPDVARSCVQSGETSAEINQIPLNGSNLYVRLWSKKNGVWEYEDFELETDEQVDATLNVERTYLVHDHLGTPRFGYDESQALTWRWASDAFGSQAPIEDADQDGRDTVLNIRFPGQYFDAESGLYYNWNRYYDSETGRYVTSDPIGLDGGLNTYAYVDGNPLRYTDPTGEAIALIPMCIAGLAAGVSALLLRNGLINACGDDGSQCSFNRDDDVDDNCEELYQSTLRTCASLTGRNKFRCFEAARINREQCYDER